MKIRINKKYSINSDSNSYTIIIHGKGKNKKGQEINTETIEGYYTKFHFVLEGLIESKIKRSEATTLIELGRDVESIRKDIKNINDKLFLVIK